MNTPSVPYKSAAAALLVALCMTAQGCAERQERALVLAAASTIDAVEAAVADFSAGDDVPVEVSFGPTSVLARQIEEGAPADLMLSASVAWADYVEQRVAVARRVALVGNQLAVVAPAGAVVADTTLEEIAARAGAFARIAIADPASVPAGIYAAEALRNLSLWESVQSRLIPTVDVRAALALVAGREADAGFVYASDAASSPDVRVIARIDPRLHEPIEYPLLLLEDAGPAAQRLFEYLLSERGRAHFHQRGFTDAGS